MNTIAIDTHRIVKRLRDNGFSEAQAEVFTDILVETADSSLKSSATKADLNEIAAAIRSDIHKEVTPLKADISLLKWMIGTLLAVNIAIATKMLFG